MSVFAAPGAYDRAITVFSPDGRLFQVEYAMELVNRGATIIGIQSTEGLVLGSEENIEVLEEAGFSWKIFRVDDHIAAAIVGLSSDATNLHSTCGCKTLRRLNNLWRSRQNRDTCLWNTPKRNLQRLQSHGIGCR